MNDGGVDSRPAASDSSEVAALRRRIAVYQAVIDALPYAIFWKDPALDFLGCSQSIAVSAGRPDPDAIVGLSDFDLPWTRAQSEAFRADDRDVLAADQPRENIIEPQRQADGSERWLETSKRPLRGRDGELLGVVGWFRDITEQQQAARAAEEASRALLQALSTPLLPVADGVIVLPLIGVLDPVRIEQVRRTLLAGVVRYQAQVVIVDVTGVEGDETPPLAGLVDSARGVALLGATCMLTGIRPAVARALVERDIDLSGLLILRDLKAGIARALALRAASPG